MYQEKLGRLKRQGLIGLIIGLAVAIFVVVDMKKFIVAPFILFPLVFAGAVYGWKKFGRLFYGVGSIPFMIIVFMLRAAISLMIGWFLYPLELIYTAVKAKNE